MHWARASQRSGDWRSATRREGSALGGALEHVAHIHRSGVAGRYEELWLGALEEECLGGLEEHDGAEGVDLEAFAKQLRLRVADFGKHVSRSLTELKSVSSRY